MHSYCRATTIITTTKQHCFPPASFIPCNPHLSSSLNHHGWRLISRTKGCWCWSSFLHDDSWSDHCCFVVWSFQQDFCYRFFASQKTMRSAMGESATKTSNWVHGLVAWPVEYGKECNGEECEEVTSLLYQHRSDDVPIYEMIKRWID